ncbi:flagellar basal body rod protein FlgC [Hwanghaeella grinnelliae]|uniref:Flagellar basal-body rod protein FlgC n=1 Tax=Hwanghaeella grinnelliae TaxID=2500179 RepID=A0A3S2WPY7_9PROT|nr:flagellar basal body rod protein FlgC [Hwanghaeella grinnelliae]RVU34639.1 flagellar basal body rod protein FlgC [Hwanghaeella grinnelliae]
MTDSLKGALFVAGSGMRAQGTRIRVIAENIANQTSTADTPGGDPYRRKVVTFQNALDRQLDLDTVRVRRVTEDPSAFKLQFDPNHPAADENGYYKMPNVTGLIETMDMLEAQRTYQANVSVIENTKRMVSTTLDLLR